MAMRMNLPPKNELRNLAVNFFNYGIFQSSTYIVPLITIPYIIRVVGIENYGIISLANGIANYIRVGVDYGWNILGIQYIARAGKDNKKRGEIVSAILSQQMFLVLVGGAVLGLAVLLLPKLQREYLVFFLAYGLVPGNMLILTWFYVGAEQVKDLNYIFLSSKLLYVLLIFFLLKPLNNFVWVVVFNSLSLLAAGMGSLFLLRFKYGIRIRLYGWKKFSHLFKEGWPIFVSYFSTNFYRNSNILILSIFASERIIGIYSVAEKAVKVVQSTFMPLSQTLYPYIAKISKTDEVKAAKYLRYIIWGMAILSGIVSALMFILAPLIIRLLAGTTPALGVLLVRVGSLVVLFGVLNYILGVIYLTNFGFKEKFSHAVVSTGVFGIVSCFILSYFFSATGTMLSFTLSELFLLLLLTHYVRKYKRMGKLV
jgi:PST family polysaccharide transporter